MLLSDVTLNDNSAFSLLQNSAQNGTFALNFVSAAKGNGYPGNLADFVLAGCNVAELNYFYVTINLVGLTAATVDASTALTTALSSAVSEILYIPQVLIGAPIVTDIVSDTACVSTISGCISATMYLSGVSVDYNSAFSLILNSAEDGSFSADFKAAALANGYTGLLSSVMLSGCDVETRSPTPPPTPSPLIQPSSFFILFSIGLLLSLAIYIFWSRSNAQPGYEYVDDAKTTVQTEHITAKQNTAISPRPISTASNRRPSVLRSVVGGQRPITALTARQRSSVGHESPEKTPLLPQQSSISSTENCSNISEDEEESIRLREIEASIDDDERIRAAGGDVELTYDHVYAGDNSSSELYLPTMSSPLARRH
jgi:hypothetical protein